MTEKLQPTTPIEPEAGLRAGTGKATEEHDAEGIADQTDQGAGIGVDEGAARYDDGAQ